jgi:hypothetical protein
MFEILSVVSSPVTEKVWSEQEAALTAVGVMLAVL